MTDLVDLTQHVQHIKPHVQHIHHAAVPIVKQGFSMLSIALTSLASLAVGGGLGWYLCNRGLKGIQQDLNNAQNEVAKLEAAAKAASHAPAAA
jgi:hypothetical protein